jgi:hypothetical protein
MSPPMRQAGKKNIRPNKKKFETKTNLLYTQCNKVIESVQLSLLELVPQRHLKNKTSAVDAIAPYIFLSV